MVRGPELGFHELCGEFGSHQEDKSPKKGQGLRRTGRQVVRTFKTGKQIHSVGTFPEVNHSRACLLIA